MRLFLLGVLFFTLQVPSVLAAEDGQGAENTLDTIVRADEITVVGRKEGRSLFEIPTSVSVVGSRELRLFEIDDIKNLASIIPNMFMPNYGTKLTSPIYIRGIGSRINSPSVGLYVDGIPYFEKSAFDFDFTDISSIEVLRGPQGTLYGRNTMGGIINVTTKSPFTYEGTTVSVTGGNHGVAKASVSDYRKITEHFGYGIIGHYQHNDGFFYNETLSEFADRLNSGGGRIKLAFKKGRHELNVVSNVEYSDQSGYPYMMLDTETMTTTSVDYNRASFYRRMLNSNGVNYTYTTPKIVLTSRTSHQYSRDHQGIDQDFSADDKYYINQEESQNMVTQEVEVRRATKGRINWIVGTSAFYQNLDRNVRMDYFGSNKTTDKYYDTPRYGAAVYGQATLERLFTDNLSLTVGLRYDFEKAQMSYLFNELKSKTTEIDRFTNKLTHQQLSPKFALQYMVKQNVNIYATVTKGYKAGGFNTSFVTDSEEYYSPEFSWNYELGSKYSLWDGKLSGYVALFLIDWKDQQVNQPLSTGTGQLVRNAGESQSKGFEVSVAYRPIPKLNIAIDYGYTDAKFIDYVAGVDKDYSGNRLAHIPKNTVSTRIDYTFTSRSSKVYDYITLSAQCNGVGGLFWNDNNSVDQDFYNLLDARASISRNSITFAFWAKNITNTKYNAYYFEALGSSFIQQGRPFTMGADLTIKF